MGIAVPCISSVSEKLFEKSELCNNYFSSEYVTMFTDLKRKEIYSFNSEISDIEYKWYLNL